MGPWTDFPEVLEEVVRCCFDQDVSEPYCGIPMEHLSAILGSYLAVHTHHGSLLSGFCPSPSDWTAKGPGRAAAAEFEGLVLLPPDIDATAAAAAEFEGPLVLPPPIAAVAATFEGLLLLLPPKPEDAVVAVVVAAVLLATVVAAIESYL